MVDALLRRIPALLPDVSFLLLRHPLARRPLSIEPNVREVTVSCEANGPASLFALPRLVDLSRVDVFHAPSNILPAAMPMRTLVTVHDLMWLTDPWLCGASGLWGRVQTWFFRNGLRRALCQADHVIAISEATREEIVAWAPSAAHRCTVIPHGVDPRFRPSADCADGTRVRQRYAPGALAHVLVVGRAAPYKNQHRAVRAFLAAFADRPGIHLVVVQRLGLDGDRLLRLARDAGAGDRVHVVPPMPDADLIALYRSALCLCHPSMQEGWGMPIGEALACGCPVITSRASAMPEVAGPAALYVDPTSVTQIALALRSLVNDSVLRTSLAKEGLRRVETLSWQRCALRTADVYREALCAARNQ
jgi:glycosyltransferase involved in cell wall biosynthesis